MKTKLFLALLLAAPATAQAQTMTVDDYSPRSTLKVPGKVITRAKFPFVDIHSHHRSADPATVREQVRTMDALNLRLSINLSGGSGDRLRQLVDGYNAVAPGRFVVFANLDFACAGASQSGCVDQPGWTERAVKQLEADVKYGAKGLKIAKNLGMDVLDSKGNRIATNDPRLDPVWAKAGQLGIPVLIHTADPHQFWLPHDKYNERWFELKETNRMRDPEKYPPWELLMAEQWDIIKKHRNTNFISAHLGWLGGDLERLGKLMDERPNMYTELGAVLAELGRQPRTAKAWLTKYQDRVLMGKDTYTPDEFHTYFRVLESEDEYFEYYRKRHAFWRMYGLGLSDVVLQKLYYQNALKLLPGVDRSAFPR